jgi:hypothetical protein
MRSQGVLPKCERLQMRALGGFENPERTQVNWLPALAWNNYDKTSLGLALYSFPVPTRRFEFGLAPMYSFASRSFSGSANLRWQFFPSGKTVQRLALDLDAKTFSYNYNWHYDFYDRYFKIAPRLTFEFKKSEPTSPWSHQLSLRPVYIEQHYGEGKDAANRIYESKTKSYLVNDLQYQLVNDFVLAPFSVTAHAQQGKGFVKFFAHFNQKFLYRQKGKAFFLHAFAGWMDTQKPEIRADFLPNGRPGFFNLQNDYLYDESLLGRNDQTGLFSQQIFQRDANLKTLASLIGSRTWMVGLGLRSGIPNPLPIESYIDMALLPDPFEDGKTQFLYSGGIAVPIVRNVFEVYFPLLESYTVTESAAYDARKLYIKRITFLLNINQLNPWKLVNNLKF